MILIKIILSIVFFFLACNVLYMLLFSIAGVLRSKKRYLPVEDKRNIAVFIPAYAEDSVIVDTALHAGNHDYPNDKFEVFVIADKLKPETMEKLFQLKVSVIPVQFEKSTKARSLKYALQQIPEGKFEIAMILDADNIMERGCLEKVNAAFHQGFRMVQLHRCAKNTNTSTAVLDAISEEINNHIFRQGHRALGLSSATIGSGMAFDFKAFRDIMIHTDKLQYSGDDREVTVRMLERGFVCEYIEDGRVFDEKVQSGRVLEPQRTRWMSAQLRYIHEFWFKYIKKTFSNGIHYFDFAIQTLTVPRVLLLFFLGMIMIFAWLLELVFKTTFYPNAVSWSVLFFLYIFSLFISIYGRIPMVSILKASLSLPMTFISVFRAMLRSSPTRQGFVRTPKEFSGEAE